MLLFSKYGRLRISGLAASLWTIAFGTLGAVVTDRTIALVSMWAAIGGSVVAVIIMLMSGYADFLRPGKQEKKRLAQLKRPADVFFLIVSAQARTIEWAHQDERDHELKEIVLQSNTEQVVEILVRPKVFFSTTSVNFGCHTNFTDMPAAKEFHAVLEGDVGKPGGFVKMPGIEIGHHIVHPHQYQIIEPYNWTPGVDVVWGYKIQTKGAGRFPCGLFFMGSEAAAKADDLVIRVEDSAPIKMMCIKDTPDHETHQIRPHFKHG